MVSLRTTLCALVSGLVLNGCVDNKEEQLKQIPAEPQQPKHSQSESEQEIASDRIYEGQLLSIKGYYCDVLHNSNTTKKHYHCDIRFMAVDGKEYYLSGFDYDEPTKCKYLMHQSQRVLNIKHSNISGGTEKDDEKSHINETYSYTRIINLDDERTSELLFHNEYNGKSMGPRVKVESPYSKSSIANQWGYLGLKVIRIDSMLEIEFLELPSQ